MTLSPFVFSYGAGTVYCFDEASPCVMEQYSACVIDVTDDQAKYVPWLICMDTDGETPSNVETCCNKLGIDYSAVSTCQRTRGMDLLKNKLLAHDSRVRGTPTVFVDGSKVDSQYSAIKKALCKADASLTACAGVTLAV